MWLVDLFPNMKPLTTASLPALAVGSHHRGILGALGIGAVVTPSTTARKRRIGATPEIQRAINVGVTCCGCLSLMGCVVNTNVAVTKDSVVVQNNISVSEKLLKLLVWF